MKIINIDVTISGLSDILFNRFIDHSKEKRPPEQKLYIYENSLVLPATNIDAFLFGENPSGCAKTFEKKKGKDYIRIGYSHIKISPFFIFFKDEKGQNIEFENFNDKRFYVLEQGGRTKQSTLSIKQEAEPRPALKLPWSLSFKIDLVENDLIDSTKLYNWFCAGGIQIAIGAFRPKFGRFEVKNWKEKD